VIIKFVTLARSNIALFQPIIEYRLKYFPKSATRYQYFITKRTTMGFKKPRVVSPERLIERKLIRHAIIYSNRRPRYVSYTRWKANRVTSQWAAAVAAAANDVSNSSCKSNLALSRPRWKPCSVQSWRVRLPNLPSPPLRRISRMRHRPIALNCQSRTFVNLL